MLGVGNRGELNIVLRVKDDGSVVVQKFGQESEKGFARGKRGADGMNQSLTNLQRSLITAISSVVTLAVGGRLIEDFKKSEQAVAALDASLISMGRTTPELSAKLQALASQIQRNGIIDDDVIIKGQSFLTTYGAITDDLLPRTTLLMADLAAKMGGDAVQAANLLGKASLGMTGELARIGITLSDATKESKDFGAILGEIEAQVGGMNAALGATATGGITQFANQWGNVREQLGQVLALSLSPYLRELSQGMDISNDSAQSWAASIRGAIESIAIGVAQVVDVIDDPVLAVSGYAGKLWDQYLALPEFAQEAGLVGALLMGTKGRVALLAVLAALDALDLSKFDNVTTDDQFIKGSEDQLRERLAQVEAQLEVWRDEQSRAWYDWRNALPSPIAVMPSQAELEQLKSQLVAALAGTVPDDLLGNESEARLRQRLTEVDAQLDIWREAQTQAWQDWSAALPSLTDNLPTQQELEQTKLQLIAALDAAANGINDLPPLPNLADALLGEGDKGDTSAEDRVRRFFDRVNDATEAARAQAAERAAELAAGGGGNLIGSGVGPADDEVGKTRVRLAEQLLALDESFLSEREALENQYLEKQFLIEEALDTETQSYELYYERRSALDQWYFGQQKRFTDADVAIAKEAAAAKQVLVTSTTNHAIGLLQALAGRSKAAAFALLALEKAQAIATVIVNTAAADATITKQLGIFAGPAIAANHTLAALNIGLIAATGLVQASSIGSGGGASPVYEANPGTGTPVAGPGFGDTNREQISPTASQGPRVLQVVIDMGSKQYVREVLIPELIDAESDGVAILRVVA